MSRGEGGRSGHAQVRSFLSPPSFSTPRRSTYVCSPPCLVKAAVGFPRAAEPYLRRSPHRFFPPHINEPTLPRERASLSLLPSPHQTNPPDPANERERERVSSPCNLCRPTSCSLTLTANAMAMEILADGLLTKVALFVIVQVLVYLILSGSSSVFSEEKTKRRLASFRTSRSVSVRRMLAVLSDMPPGGELSPSTSAAAMPPIPEGEEAHEA